MTNLFYSLAALWIRRWARPDPAALAVVSPLSPAVVVTGGSRGIGAALAERFAAERSHAVLLVARDTDTLAKTADEIRHATAATVLTLSLDVTRGDAPAVIDAALLKHNLYLDYLVNNAGVGLAGPFTSHSEAEIEQLIRLNVSAVTRLMRHVLPDLRARARGGVLNVASMAGFVPGPNQAAYYASKAYVISLTRAVSQELRGSGVRISVVAPGPVETSFHEAMGAERSLYRVLVPSRSPVMVANAAYRGFMLGRSVIVPGVIETLNSAFLRLAPYALSVPVVGLLLRKGDSDRQVP